jgi:hypothetical protein
LDLPVLGASKEAWLILPDSVGNITPPAKLRLSDRADLRGANRLGHAEEDHHALAAAAGRERFVGTWEAAIDVLPVVHHPDVTRRRDRDIGLNLQAAPT